MSVNITPDQAQKLLTDSSNNYEFSLLSFSMLITRLKVVYAKDSSQAILQDCTNEVNEFLQKYGSIMEKDSAVISKL